MGNIKYIESKIAELKLQLSGCKASKAEKSMFRDEILKLEQMLEEEEKKKNAQCDEVPVNLSETYQMDEDELEL